MFDTGSRFTMTRIEYDKEDPEAAEDDWVMMIQVHLLKGLPPDTDDTPDVDWSLNKWEDFWKDDRYKMFNSENLRK